jgi:hypothetical protein
MSEGEGHCPRGDDSKRVKYTEHILKSSFPQRTSWPISIRLGANHPWVRGILNCSNKGPHPLQRVDNHKNAEMGLGHLKIFFSRTTEPK